MVPNKGNIQTEVKKEQEPKEKKSELAKYVENQVKSTIKNKVVPQLKATLYQTITELFNNTVKSLLFKGNAPQLTQHKMNYNTQYTVVTTSPVENGIGNYAELAVNRPKVIKGRSLSNNRALLNLYFTDIDDAERAKSQLVRSIQEKGLYSMLSFYSDNQINLSMNDYQLQKWGWVANQINEASMPVQNVLYGNTTYWFVVLPEPVLLQ